MQNFGDLSMEEAFQMSITPHREMIGREFRIDHLTSEKGKALNGKTCRVVGFTANHTTNPDARVQCAVNEGDNVKKTKPILLKSHNLVSAEANIMRTYMPASEPLPDKEIMKGLRQGLSQHSNINPTDRADLYHRTRLYKNLLKKLERSSRTSNGNGNDLKDEDYCFPCGAAPAMEHEDEQAFDYIMRINRPACVGNNQLDVRLMDQGLKGDGVATCNICMLTLESTETKLVTLPCVHMFHGSCLEQWLESDLGSASWNCPTCRQSVPHNLETYIIRYELELRNRFQEFLLSGFCPKCILWIMERNRNQNLPMVNESGEQLSIGCVGQTQHKVFCFPPP